jgi:hypothetical protein
MPLSHADAQRQAMSATSQKGVAMIRYFFFALVLLMAICPAPARATELPKHMLGLWCFNKIATEELDTDNTSVWDKATSFDDCANRGGVKLWRQGNQSGYVIGRFNRRAHCKIDKLKLSRPGSICCTPIAGTMPEPGPNISSFRVSLSKRCSVERHRKANQCHAASI